MIDIEWNSIDFGNKKPNSKGEVKILCPNCSHTRRKKTDPCLSVNIETGVGYCWNCEGTTIREKKSKKITYDLPPQKWENFTKLSDKVVKWFSKYIGHIFTVKHLDYHLIIGLYNIQCTSQNQLVHIILIFHFIPKHYLFDTSGKNISGNGE